MSSCLISGSEVSWPHSLNGVQHFCLLDKYLSVIPTLLGWMDTATWMYTGWCILGDENCDFCSFPLSCVHSLCDFLLSLCVSLCLCLLTSVCLCFCFSFSPSLLPLCLSFSFSLSCMFACAYVCVVKSQGRSLQNNALMIYFFTYCYWRKDPWGETLSTFCLSVWKQEKYLSCKRSTTWRLRAEGEGV